MTGTRKWFDESSKGIFVALALALAFLFGAAVGPTTPAVAQDRQLLQAPSKHVNRLVDGDAGVVCYDFPSGMAQCVVVGQAIARSIPITLEPAR